MRHLQKREMKLIEIYKLITTRHQGFCLCQALFNLSFLFSSHSCPELKPVLPFLFFAILFGLLFSLEFSFTESRQEFSIRPSLVRSCFLERWSDSGAIYYRLAFGSNSITSIVCCFFCLFFAYAFAPAVRISVLLILFFCFGMIDGDKSVAPRTGNSPKFSAIYSRGYSR